jgi:hypothetical protein
VPHAGKAVEGFCPKAVHCAPTLCTNKKTILKNINLNLNFIQRKDILKRTSISKNSCFQLLKKCRKIKY